MKKNISVSALKKTIKELEIAKRRAELDRDIYRGYAKKHFKDNFELISSGKHFTAESIVKELAVVFAKAESFYFWW